MLSAPIIVAVLAGYLALLALVGWWAERSNKVAEKQLPRSVMYGLSLATLCSAWTYFGAVGDTSNGSWLFLANALGPIIAITIGYPVWRRIAVLSKQENVGSLADFLAARYGKSRALGILVTIVATLGALPYIALQLSVLAQAWDVVGHGWASGPVQTLVLVVLLAGFAMLFGARRPSLTQHNRGFVGIIAVESIVKLVGLLCVAGLCLLLFSARGSVMKFVAFIPPPLPAIDLSFVTLALLCTVTAFTLPRQFHLGFVTLEDPADIENAAWIVPAYFLTWVVATLIIAAGIRAGFGMPAVGPHLQVLGIPMADGATVIAMLALLGGFSAGAAMVIVETTAISAMVSNEIVLPLIAARLQRGGTQAEGVKGRNAGHSILLVRRCIIVLIGLLSWLYFLAIRDVAGPTQLGQTALIAFAQLLPALFGGIYWRQGHARGAIAGLLVGMLVWGVGIAGPGLFPQVPAPAGLDLLWPDNSETLTNLTIFGSLVLNASLYVLVSLRSSPQLIDTIQANSFVLSRDRSETEGARQITATLGDLNHLLVQFLGEEEAKRAMRDTQSLPRIDAWDDACKATPAAIRKVERLLAGVIGAPSARNVVAISLARETQDAAEISQILDEAGHAVHFSRELLQTTLESLPQGVAVVDPELRLVAWNTKCLEFLNLPLEQAHVGRSLPDFLRAMPAAPERHLLWQQLEDQFAEIRCGNVINHEVPGERGATIHIGGRPLGREDYLLILADITDLKQAEKILSEDKELLEARVEERTHELVVANSALAEAKAIAEQITSAQGRFVAAASHDLVQPLHAARLFNGNALVGTQEDQALHALLEKADIAVDGAHKMLTSLLNLSRLETGSFKPTLEPVDAGELLASLGEEFSAQAKARGLNLIVKPTTWWIETDRDLLRSILQNLMLNALRYTVEGRVVVLVRRAKGGAVRIEVRDTGVGISPDKMETAFGEFSRLSEGRLMSDGAGLGLSIVARIAQVLGHVVSVRSVPGRGSVFSVTLPQTQALPKRLAVKSLPVHLSGLRVLCVDDERDVLVGMKALIERWGGVVTAVESVASVDLAAAQWDVAIADYHLGGENGLSLLKRLGDRVPVCILVTATPDETWGSAIETGGITLLQKPLAPLVLQRLLAEVAASLYPDCVIATS